MEKIVTHKPPRHTDDFLSVAFLKSEYPEAHLEFLQPNNVPSDYLENEKICLVDIGNDFNPEKANFDHHQNIKLPCSLSQILSYYKGTDYSMHPVIKLIDSIDRFGIINTARKTNYKFSPQTEQYKKPILMVNINKNAHKIKNLFFYLLEQTTDYNEFWRLFYEKLDKQGLLDNAKEMLKKEETEFNRKILLIEKYKIGDLNVIVSPETFSPNHYKVFQLTHADLIVEPNVMNDQQTAIIRNSQSPKVKYIDLNKIFDLYPKVFIHNTGFLAVIDVHISNFNIYHLQKVYRDFLSRMNP